MSLPLLQTSPTVQLEIAGDRQLEANLVLSPDPSNALRLSSAGLYAKDGQRRLPWWVTSLTAQPITVAVQTQQAMPWLVENYDPAGLFDLVNQPTRITFSEAGRYFSNLFIQASLVGGNCASCSAEMMLVKNGTTFVGGQLCTGMAAGTTGCIGCYADYVDVEAGDYLEAFWRWLSFTTLTATSATLVAEWGGGAITE